MTVKYNKFKGLLVLAALVFLLPACGRDQQAPPGEKAKAATPAATATDDKLAQVRPDQTNNDVTSIKGKVLEVVDTGSFVFLLLKTAEKQTWATVPAVEVKVGEEVTLLYASVFNNFYSKSMDRTFGELIFSSGIKGKASGSRFAAASRQKPAANVPAAAK